MKIVAATLATILFATMLQAQTPGRVVLYSGLAADLVSTEIAIHKGAHEANPLLQNRAVRLTLPVALTLYTDMATKHLPIKAHSRFVSVVGLVHFSLAVNNVRISFQIKR